MKVFILVQKDIYADAYDRKKTGKKKEKYKENENK